MFYENISALILIPRISHFHSFILLFTTLFDLILLLITVLFKFFLVFAVSFKITASSSENKKNEINMEYLKTRGMAGITIFNLNIVLWTFPGLGLKESPFKEECEWIKT